MYLPIFSRCFLIRGTILESFVFSSKSLRRLRCARYFCSYAVCEKATETCSPVTHSSRLFSIYQNPLTMKKKKIINPYNRQDQGERRQRKHLIFKKLWVHHAIVLLSPEPGFVDERLDDRCQEYPSFLLGILLGWGQKFLFKRLYK